MPSETPEPTQENLNKARHILWKIDLRGTDGAWLSAQAAIADALAAEAAPLREEIERLGREVAQSDALLAGREQLRAAAEAKVLSLEAEIGRLKGAFLARFKPLYLREMFAKNPEKAIAFWDKQADAFCSNAQARAHTLEKQLAEARKASGASRLLAADKQEELNDAIRARDDALAAASRAREEQGALRAAALEMMQERVERWVRMAFTEGALTDRWERIARMVEEVIELAQAEGMTCDEVIKSAAWVFNRPSGDVNQEVGGVMVTLLAWAAGRQTDLGACALTEIERIEQPATIEKIRRKQAEKAAAGTGHNFAALAPPAAESQENQQQLTGKEAK